MKFKYKGKRPCWFKGMKYLLGDISNEKFNDDFEKIIVKKKKKKITKEDI